MLVYDGYYDDSFVVDSIEEIDMLQVETDILTYLDTLGVTEEPFRRKACVCGVYVELCKLQLENEGFKDKLSVYEKCYTDTIQDSKNIGSGAISNGVSSVPLFRG